MGEPHLALVKTHVVKIDVEHRLGKLREQYPRRLDTVSVRYINKIHFVVHKLSPFPLFGVAYYT